VIDKTAKNLAQNLVGLRKTNRLTQHALAQLSGATRASIALIESGQSNPTLEVLLKLSDALGVSVDELIQRPRAESRHYLAGEIREDRRSENGVTLRKLLPDSIQSTEMDELRLDPGAIMRGSPHIEGTREYFACLEGSVLIGVLGEGYTLRQGDVLSFPGDRPHSYKNPGRRRCRGVSVVFFDPIRS
jgi:transcriptional regulator with XRE-family HTH domain